MGENGEVCDAREGETCGCGPTNRDVSDGISVDEEGAQIIVEILFEKKDDRGIILCI